MRRNYVGISIVVLIIAGTVAIVQWRTALADEAERKSRIAVEAMERELQQEREQVIQRQNALKKETAVDR